jgi:hypothetical protein
MIIWARWAHLLPPAQVITPLALRAQHQIRGDLTAPSATSLAMQQQLMGPSGGLGARAPWARQGNSGPPTCADLADELPAGAARRRASPGRGGPDAHLMGLAGAGGQR